MSIGTVVSGGSRESQRQDVLAASQRGEDGLAEHGHVRSALSEVVAMSGEEKEGDESSQSNYFNLLKIIYEVKETPIPGIREIFNSVSTAELKRHIIRMVKFVKQILKSPCVELNGQKVDKSDIHHVGATICAYVVQLGSRKHLEDNVELMSKVSEHYEFKSLYYKQCLVVVESLTNQQRRTLLAESLHHCKEAKPEVYLEIYSVFLQKQFDVAIQKTTSLKHLWPLLDLLYIYSQQGGLTGHEVRLLNEQREERNIPVHIIRPSSGPIMQHILSSEIIPGCINCYLICGQYKYEELRKALNCLSIQSGLSSEASWRRRIQTLKEASSFLSFVGDVDLQIEALHAVEELLKKIKSQVSDNWRIKNHLDTLVRLAEVHVSLWDLEEANCKLKEAQDLAKQSNLRRTVDIQLQLIEARIFERMGTLTNSIIEEILKEDLTNIQQATVFEMKASISADLISSAHLNLKALHLYKHHDVYVCADQWWQLQRKKLTSYTKTSSLLSLLGDNHRANLLIDEATSNPFHSYAPWFAIQIQQQWILLREGKGLDNACLKRIINKGKEAPVFAVEMQQFYAHILLAKVGEQKYHRKTCMQFLNSDTLQSKHPHFEKKVKSDLTLLMAELNQLEQSNHLGERVKSICMCRVIQNVKGFEISLAYESVNQENCVISHLQEGWSIGS
ncbi:hypothetical protein PROFUN_12534 [Planoprotostelium fungivorum]|uniref:Uncharacterized protein n=1 Tax=Planoprotostelium fungivorum TaxID=1890364 RepID=A0A2P6MS44_9EUKA|nr:hypothetical protein PROFUN_12534 [Planoprotostelium fungivorum]